MMRLSRRIFHQIAALICAVLLPLAASAASDLTIYGDSLAAGWSDWSWSTTRNLSNATPVHAGTGSIAVTITGAWGSLYLHPDAAINATSFDQIRFWVHGGAAGGQKVRFVANSSLGYAFSLTANTWTQVSIPLSALGNPATLTDFYWQDTNGSAQATFYLDDIVLVAGSGSVPPPSAGPALSIDAGADRHTISADIYGINLLNDEALATELRLPVRRWGGNSTTRYNWQNDTTNTGMDWYYENIPQDNPNPATLPDGSATDRFVEQNVRTGTRTLMTVPTIGWAAKRRTAGHPYDCAFKVSKYGAQQSTDPWDSDCGNGIASNGSNITGNDPTDTSVAIGPSFVSAWIKHLLAKYGTAANGGVAYYALDNEPGIWNGTHRDIHPLPPTYDEMRDRSTQYGAAIKAADPSARILGPVEDGWCRYLYSSIDNCLPAADYLAHGSVQYVPWYLQQMHSYEQLHALRILDYLDLHYYPAANGVSLSTAGSAATQALRLRSTRSLWDPTYIDESWISDTAPGGVAVQLIPRMKKWVADNYPGTKTAITEYNWGGYEHINGALAQADVLGLFGRENIDLATFWGDVLATQPGSFAFRMFRNYDGNGRGFGETSVQSASTDQDKLSVYAAQRSADGVLTIMVINKSSGALTSAIGLAGFSPQAMAKVYRYSTSNLAAVEHAADQAVTSSGFAASFPANSITLLALSPLSQATVTQQALFVNASTSLNKTSVLRVVNTAGAGGALTASAYDESGTLLGSANGNLGTIGANQTLSFTSAQMENLLGFTPSAGTAKYSVYLSASLAGFQLINYTRDVATGSLTLSQSLTADRITGATASSVTRSAWFMSSSTSANKTNVLRIINTSGQSGSLTATVYDEAGNVLGSAGKALGAIAARQMLTYTSAQFETAIGFTPPSPTAKYRAVFSANLPSMELINFTKDIASGSLTLVQAQIEDRPSPSSTSSSRNALLVYPSNNGATYTTMRIVNPNATVASLTASVYDEAGNALVTNGTLGTVGANQILALTSSQIEAALHYAPTSSSARYRMVIAANVPSFEVINDAKDAVNGTLYLAQAQTDNRAAGSASSTTRNAYIVYPSASTTGSQIQVINTTAQSSALTASAYDDSGALVATNKALGTLAANQMLSFTSAQLESLLAYTPPTAGSTWRIVFSAGLTNFEVINYATNPTGLLVLAQPQTE